MNKYQEALEELAMYAGTNDMVDLDEYAFVAGYESKLQELVDRATPMKAIRIPTKHNVIIFQCPKCLIQIQFIKTYCGDCGQALDWSYEE